MPHVLPKSTKSLSQLKSFGGYATFASSLKEFLGKWGGKRGKWLFITYN